jgi:TPR repeat protein
LYRSPEGELHDQAEARRLYERSARLGEPRASLSLGEMVAKGEGSAADERKASQYYQQAAAAGLEREASRALAALYLSPEGNLKDPAEAMRLYERSAALGDGMSLISLGDVHAEGAGVPVDEARAKEFYNRAGNAGFLKERAARLARMYRSPEGVLNDAGEAAALFEQAAALGDVRSVISLGSMFAEGAGVEPDEVKAKELFDLAATKGLKAEATRQIAELYRSPEGALDDIDEAIRLFELAVSLGDVPSMLALGEMYASGETLRGDKSSAGTGQEGIN